MIEQNPLYYIFGDNNRTRLFLAYPTVAWFEHGREEKQGCAEWCPKSHFLHLLVYDQHLRSTNLAALAKLTGVCTMHAYIQFEQHKLAVTTLHVHTHLIIAARPLPSTRAGGLCSPRARYDDSFHASCHARSRRRLSSRTRVRTLSSSAPIQAKETSGSPRTLSLLPPF